MGINLGSSPISNLKVGSDQVNKVYLGTTEVWSATPPTPTIRALKFSSVAAQNLKINTTSSIIGDLTPYFEYSLDNGQTWTVWNQSDFDTGITFGNGVDLYLRGSNTYLAKGGNVVQFITNPYQLDADLVDCTGNIMHLFDYTQDLTAFPDATNSEGVRQMFSDFTALRTTPDLPATALADSNCYYRTFYNCAHLLSSPKLPATTLKAGCYRDMFRGCSLLEIIPSLPATTLATNCYNGMFRYDLNIKMSTTQDAEYTNEYVFGANPAGYANNMFGGTGGTFTGAPDQTTYYTSNTIIS